MKKLFVFAFVVLVVLATANPVSAQGNTPPEGDGWKCIHVQGNLAIGSTMGLTKDYPIDQVWVDGELFTQNIPDEEHATFMILNLGTNDIRIKKNVGDPIQIVCYHMVLPVTATPSSTATPIATATQSATATSAVTATSLPTATPTTTPSVIPTSATAKTIIIAIVAIAICVIVAFVLRKRKIRH